MTIKTHQLRDTPSIDPYAVIVGLFDQVFMLAYRHARRNARRLTHMLAVVMPLMVLLVGSCKMSQLPWAYGSNAGAQQFRLALFPDQLGAGADYQPAAGYVSRARAFVEGQPEALKMLTPQEISYLFGTPSMRRQDADAQVWQYKTDACVVDFYFYGKKELSFIDVRLKEDLAIDSPIRQKPVSNRAQKNCLKSVATEA